MEAATPNELQAIFFQAPTRRNVRSGPLQLQAELGESTE